MKNATVKEKTVAIAVASWNIRFRPKYTLSEQELLAREYHEDLVSEGVSEEEFIFAERSVRKSCAFFPKMCEILGYIKDKRARQSTSPVLELEAPKDTPKTRAYRAVLSQFLRGGFVNIKEYQARIDEIESGKSLMEGAPIQ